VKIINPLEIKESDLPLIVLADNLRSIFAWGIRQHTNGNYSHIMEIYRPGYFASQGWTYKEVSVERYMKGNYRLKFWKCRDLTDKEKKKWLALTKKELKAPWWKRRYDFLGILGQATFIRIINNPFIKYCSERIAIKMRLIDLPIKKHPTPSECNFVMRNSERMEVFGHYILD